MKTGNLLVSLSVAGALLLPGMALPDDIDLYTGGEQVTGAASNVLIVLDNTSNFSASNQGWTDSLGNNIAQGAVEAETISTVVGTLKDTINVGLMQYADGGGGYPIFAVRNMGTTNRPVFQSVAAQIKANVGSPQYKGPSSPQYADLMNSVFRYFNGFVRFNDGTQSGEPSAANDLRDYAGNAVPVAARATLGEHGYSSGLPLSNYRAPSDANGGCAKNFVIFIGNGWPQSNGTKFSQHLADLTTAGTLLDPDVVPETSGIAAADAIDQAAPYWTRFMKKYGVPPASVTPTATGSNWNNITTYTIDVCKNNCDANQATLLSTMASEGGGKYFKVTEADALEAALTQIFAEIQAVNSVFASATLPVSVNTQGTYENQVYIGVFRPDQYARPRWYGNLKGYQFARYCDLDGDDIVDNVGSSGDERIDGNASPPSCSGDTLKLFLADRNNKPAIDQSNGSGFIDLSATSFWTQASTFWAFSPDDISGSSDAPDGPNVERGGAAYRQRTLFPVKTAASGTADIDHRKVYTCLSGCLASLSSGHQTLSSTPFANTSGNPALSSLASAWPMNVSLARAANTVTVSTASAHGLGAGDSITISGTGSTDYDKSHTVVSGSGSSLTITVTEKPENDLSGNAVISTAATVKGISSISVNAAATTATVTATAHGFTTGDTITIGGASQSFLNGTATITVLTANTFSYPITWTAPSSPATAAGTTSFGSPVNSPTNSNSSLKRPDATQPSVVLGVWSSQTPTTGNPKVVVGSTQVTVASTTPADYSGTYTLKETGGSCPGTSSFSATEKKYAYCYDLIKTESGSGMTATKTGGSVTNVNISRSGTTATATRVSGAALVGGTATISGSSQSEYNGSKVVTYVDDDHVTFTVTVTPPTSATGTATIPNEPTVTAADLIDWLRGVDNNEDENDNNSSADVRASIQGDVLHSRPLLINYGASTGIYGFYGSNDGFLRAIKGGTADTDGGEQWAFVPEEFVTRSKLARLYENSTLVRYPNSACPVPGAVTPTQRPYFWDGQLSAYQSSDLATTYLYAGMRRGGRSVYAFDVSAPAAPKIMWRINESSTGFSQLGYTWSEPKVTWIADVSEPSGKRLVVIFGAGYDPTDDDQQSGAVRGDRTGYAGIGRGVFIVDALSGGLIKFLEVPSGVRKYSFAADVTLFDYDGDGLTERIYAVDSGAQLFRFDHNVAIAPSAVNAWVINQLGNFGDTDADGGSDARRFLYPPEVVPFVYKTTSGTQIPAAMVLVGSGDREKPLPNYRLDSATNTYVQNALTCPALYPDSYFGSIIDDRFYGIVDSTATLGTATSVDEGDLISINSTSSLVGYDVCYAFETECVSGVTNAIARGWMIDLKKDPDGGGYGEEKLVNAPQVVSGVTFFATNAPQAPNVAAGICSNLGVASAYAVSPFTGLPSFDRNGDGVIDESDFAASVTGGGLPPSVTAGVVGIQNEDGTTDYQRFVIGAGGKGGDTKSPIEGGKNPIALKGTRSRVYWYYPIDTK